MKRPTILIGLFCLSSIWLSIACLALKKPSALLEPITLTPWIDFTFTPSPTIVMVFPTFTPQPITAQTYTVQEGDTLSEIAFRNQLTIDDLLLANPGIDSRIISKGATLIIPQKQGGKIVLPTPTALPLQINPVQCFPSLPAGQWCLALIQNQNPDPIDNISTIISLHQEDGKVVAEQQVALPLSRLEAGKSLPLLAFFPQPWSFPHYPNAQLISALPGRNGDGRFLPVSIQIEENTIYDNKKAARLRGKISLTTSSVNPNIYIRLAAAAYDLHHNPIGLKTWDWKGNITAVQEVPFDLTVFSVSPLIAEVDLQAEASQQ